MVCVGMGVEEGEWRHEKFPKGVRWIPRVARIGRDAERVHLTPDRHQGPISARRVYDCSRSKFESESKFAF